MGYSSQGSQLITRLTHMEPRVHGWCVRSHNRENAALEVEGRCVPVSSEVISPQKDSTHEPTLICI